MINVKKRNNIIMQFLAEKNVLEVKFQQFFFGGMKPKSGEFTKLMISRSSSRFIIFHICLTITITVQIRRKTQEECETEWLDGDWEWEWECKWGVYLYINNFMFGNDCACMGTTFAWTNTKLTVYPVFVWLFLASHNYSKFNTILITRFSFSFSFLYIYILTLVLCSSQGKLYIINF